MGRADARCLPGAAARRAGGQRSRLSRSDLADGGGLVALAPLRAGHAGDVDIGCQRSQRTDAGLIAARVLERVTVEEPAGVLERDLVALLLGAAGVLEPRPGQPRRLGARGVAVRVVDPPGGAEERGGG